MRVGWKGLRKVRGPKNRATLYLRKRLGSGNPYISFFLQTSEAQRYCNRDVGDEVMVEIQAREPAHTPAALFKSITVFHFLGKVGSLIQWKWWVGLGSRWRRDYWWEMGEFPGWPQIRRIIRAKITQGLFLCKSPLRAQRKYHSCGQGLPYTQQFSSFWDLDPGLNCGMCVSEGGIWWGLGVTLASRVNFLCRDVNV